MEMWHRRKRMDDKRKTNVSVTKVMNRKGSSFSNAGPKEDQVHQSAREERWSAKKLQEIFSQTTDSRFESTNQHKIQSII